MTPLRPALERPAKSRQRFSCLDLFCGAGGFTEGFRQAGFHTIAANDLDGWAGNTFVANHARHGTHFVPGDIACAEVQQELLHHVRDRAIDVLIGGPPCQAFSQVRNHHRIIEDPRNSLYRHFVEVIRAVRPRAFVMENVPGLENLAGGVVRRQVIADLALEGEYRVGCRVIDAADYGVPQNRLRVIFVGMRADLRTDAVFPVGTGLSELPRLDRLKSRRGWRYQNAKLPPDNPGLEWLLDPTCTKLVTVQQAIGDLLHLRPNAKLIRRPSDEPLQYDEAATTAYQWARRAGSVELFNADVPSIREDTVTRLKAIPQGGNFRDLPEALSARYLNGKKWGPELGRDNLSRKYFFAYRKLHPNHFSWTLNTKADCVYHYQTYRALTVREFARLHSFDDTYHFLHGDRHSRYRQVGNAVPPLLAKAIATALAAELAADDETHMTRKVAAGD